MFWLYFYYLQPKELWYNYRAILDFEELLSLDVGSYLFSIYKL